MVDGRSLWLLLPRQLRELPADLAAVAVAVGLVNLVVFAPVLSETPLRVPLGLLFVLFIPGYALIAALFPEQGESPTVEEETADEEGWLSSRQRSGIDGIERVALSFGLSIAVVPLIGLALNFTPWGIRLTPIMVATSGFTLMLVAVAAYRRWELPVEERFRVPYREWIARGKAEVFEPDDRLDAVLNVALALSILLAVGALGFAVMFPPDGERFTQFYVLGEDDDGELVAANYPEQVAIGEEFGVVVGVDNQEHETVEYTVIVQIQRVDFEIGPDGNVTNVTVEESLELDRFTATLGHNETLHHDWLASIDDGEFVGENRRLQFLLYADKDDEVPAQPTVENAYRDLHLWLDVAD